MYLGIDAREIAPNRFYTKFFGLSTDTKPTTDLANGSIFIEIDTSKAYFFDEENEEWLETAAGGGSLDPQEIADAVAAYLDEHPEVGGLSALGATAGHVPTAQGDGTWEWQSSGGAVGDVQVNGTSVVQNGVANVPVASANNPGTVKVDNLAANGIILDQSNVIKIDPATSAELRTGTGNRPIVAANQNRAAFYGLADAAGDTSQKTVAFNGEYTRSAKSKIYEMFNAPEIISGTNPSITGSAGLRYICGEVSTLSVRAPESGCIDVLFRSGSTPTVLTVTSGKTFTDIKWANGFDPTSLDADTTYEINILDGEYGVVGSWT